MPVNTIKDLIDTNLPSGQAILMAVLRNMLKLLVDDYYLEINKKADKSIPYGSFMIFKSSGGVGTIGTPEDSDYIMGWFNANTWIEGKYNGGGLEDINNFTLSKKIVY